MWVVIDFGGSWRHSRLRSVQDITANPHRSTRRQDLGTEFEWPELPHAKYFGISDIDERVPNYGVVGSSVSCRLQVSELYQSP
jgi:hypothetical protein